MLFTIGSDWLTYTKYLILPAQNLHKELLTLGELNPKTEARVLNLKQSEVSAKLTDMGVLQGQTVKVLFKAPLGDPIAVQVGDYVLSLRKDEASLVEVELINI